VVIKGYRSSITCTLTISGGTDFSNNDFLSLLIRNFDLERPKQKRLVPQCGFLPRKEGSVKRVTAD
jgi:hypothetical protein